MDFFRLILNFTRLSSWSASWQLPDLQAHRGYWQAGFRQNTLDSVRAAKAAGFKISEIDVRMTKDQRVILFHDENLIAYDGTQRKMRDIEYADLKYPYQPTLLSELLKDAKGTDYYNIEVKSDLRARGLLEKQVAQVIKDAHAEDRIMISSFNPLCLALMSRFLPDVPRALLVSQEESLHNFFLLKKMLFAPAIDFHLIHFDERMLSAEMISLLREKDFKYSAWTVNNSGRAKELLRLGAQSIITDEVKPDLFSQP